MGSFTENRLTKIVKRYDAKLYVEKNYKGIYQVLRQSYQHHPYYCDGAVIYGLVKAPHFIMALTHNWTASGEPCDWGIDPILKRLADIDVWSEKSFVNQGLEKHNKKVDESQRRDINNKIEDAVYESHATFKKTFADTNTANMAKIDKRKKKGV